MPEHHAILYVTKKPTEVVADIKAALVDTEVVEQTTDILSIGDVRRLILLAYQSAGEASSRCLLIVAGAIAIEAQHALLKILEEPPATTRFIFILPTSGGLLPTILSRLSVITDSEEGVIDAVFEKWIAASIPERLAQIALLAKSKDTNPFDSVTSSLISYTASNRSSLALGQQKAVEQALLYLRLRGASKKMVWENLAFALPVTDGV